MEVSIIIPIYNVEKYVIDCLNSVLNQTFRKIEIILVDDCGKDNSMKLINDFLCEYKGDINISTVTHDKNKGLSAARNTGMNVSNGKYVYFLDSDDTLPPDAIEKLFMEAKKYQADVVMGNFNVVGAKWKYVLKTIGYLNNNKKIFIDYLKNRWFVMACNKLIRKSFMTENNTEIRAGELHEVILFSFNVATKASSVVCIENNTYNYIIRNNSITTNKKRKNFDDLLYIHRYNFDIIKTRNLTSEEVNAVADYLVKCVFYFNQELFKQTSISEKEKKELNDKIMEFYRTEKKLYYKVSYKECIKSLLFRQPYFIKKKIFSII